MIFRVGIFATMNFFRVGIVLPTFFYPFQTKKALHMLRFHEYLK